MTTYTFKRSGLATYRASLPPFVLVCLLLWAATQSLHAGLIYTNGIPDPIDCCSTGSGGGPPAYDAAPTSADAVTQAQHAEAAAAFAGCRGTCGAGGGGGGGGGGAGSPCCPGDDDSTSANPSPPDATATDRFMSAGAPIWKVSEPFINLWLYDEPIAGYQPSIGGRISLALAYKQRGTTNVSPSFYNLGTNWTCSWLSYVEDDGVGTQATLMLRRGGQVTFTPDGSTLEYHTHTTLQREDDGHGGLKGFVRTFPSGSKDYYEEVPARDLRLPDGNKPAFLSARADPFGRVVQQYIYDEPLTNGTRVFRLIQVLDADGRVTTLSYTNSNQTLITGVIDPFGRNAVLQYNQNGLLTNITDAASMSSSFQYDSQNWITNLTTPYGTTTFQHVDNGFPDSGILRAIRVVDPAGGTNIYMLRQYSPFTFLETNYYPPSVPGTVPDDFDLGWRYRWSCHWGPRQAGGLPADMNSFGETECLLGRMRHWLHDIIYCYTGYEAISQVLSEQIEPSPDGITPGQSTWYVHDAQVCGGYVEGSNSLPSLVARTLPDNTVWYAAYQRDAWGRPTNVTDTYSSGYGDSPLTRSRQYTYDGLNPDLLQVTGPQGETLAGYAYTNHFVLRATNAVGDVTYFNYTPQGWLTSVKSPAGLTRTNIYFASGEYTNFVQTSIDLEINRTNTFTYTNDLVYTQTDERGVTTTNLYDTLNRLTNSANSLGAISYTYDKLDLVRVVDRMGFTNSFAYDAVRRRTAETNALGRATVYHYCACGSLESIEDAAGNSTSFSYDNAGRRTLTTYADSYIVLYNYDLLGELTNTIDGAGVSLTNWFNNQGQLYAVQDAAGYRSYLEFDIEDRVTNSYDANGVKLVMTYDNLGRTLTRSYPDGGTEYFGYSPRGLVAYTNQLGFPTHYAYDEAGRKTAETNANSEATLFSYSAAGDLLTLTDGKNQVTTWGYDPFGRVTSKLDQTSTEILDYAYDPDSRLTNRWSAAKGNTAYAYDPVGNLTTVAYPSSGTVQFAYDALNRMTNMVDRWCTNRYTYDAVGQRLTEGGWFSHDVLTNTYSNRRRIALALQERAPVPWTNGFGWDLAGRLTNVTSQAGSFNYTYTSLDPLFSGRLVQRLSLPTGAHITNSFDPVARLLASVLLNSGSWLLDSAVYGYNVGNQRTACTNATGAYVSYSYDGVGQLKVADSSVGAESHRYTYDAAWNLNYRTNIGVTQTFLVDTRNQLTNASEPIGTLSYDANGNLTTSADGKNVYVWDDENRLSQWFHVQNAITNLVDGDRYALFHYDGFGRLRLRLEGVLMCTSPDDAQAARRFATPDSLSYEGFPGAPEGCTWMGTSVTEYLYDGMQVIEERNSDNVPLVNYTRGLDLSGSLEGAGGIGGLLARSSGYYYPGNWTSHACYHADGNGNITCLIDASQSVVASYRYDPFGNTLSQSGTLADANVYRFSSKEIHANSGMYYYGYRFYDPSLQRWISADPIGEKGFELLRLHHRFPKRGDENRFRFLRNSPISHLDAFGLDGRWNKGSWCAWLEEAIEEIVEDMAAGDMSNVLEYNQLNQFFEEDCKDPPPPPPPPSSPVRVPVCTYVPDLGYGNQWNTTINCPAWTPPGWHPSPGFWGGVMVGICIVGVGTVVLAK